MFSRFSEQISRILQNFLMNSRNALHNSMKISNDPRLSVELHVNFGRHFQDSNNVRLSIYSFFRNNNRHFNQSEVVYRSFCQTPFQTNLRFRWPPKICQVVSSVSKCKCTTALTIWKRNLRYPSPAPLLHQGFSRLPKTSLRSSLGSRQTPTSRIDRDFGAFRETSRH